MEWGTFTIGGWSSPTVLVAGTFLERLQGLRYRSEGYGMLIRGGSVHGFGMRKPLLAIGLDGRRRVVGFRILHPRRVVWIRGAREVVELPIGPLPPPPGVVLTWESGGSADLVRNTHRKPE